MWELDYKESWEPKNWCFWTVVLEETLESPLGCKKLKPEGSQPWIFTGIFIGRTDAEAEAPILWPLEAKNWLIRKDPDVGKRLKAGGEGDNRGWDGWMTSPTQWTWVWVNSGSWCWTGRPGVLWFMGLQSQTQLSDWTEMNWNIVEKAAGELSCHVVGNLTNLSRCVPAGLGHWLLTEGSQLIPTADYSDSASFLSFSSHVLSVHYIPALNLGEGLQRWKLKVSALKEKVCCNHSLELSELKVTLENMTFCTCYFIKGIHIHSPHLIIITL